MKDFHFPTICHIQPFRILRCVLASLLETLEQGLSIHLSVHLSGRPLIYPQNLPKSWTKAFPRRLKTVGNYPRYQNHQYCHRRVLKRFHKINWQKTSCPQSSYGQWFPCPATLMLFSLRQLQGSSPERRPNPIAWGKILSIYLPSWLALSPCWVALTPLWHVLRPLQLASFSLFLSLSLSLSEPIYPLRLRSFLFPRTLLFYALVDF